MIESKILSTVIRVGRWKHAQLNNATAFIKARVTFVMDPIARVGK